MCACACVCKKMGALKIEQRVVRPLREQDCFRGNLTVSWGGRVELNLRFPD